MQIRTKYNIADIVRVGKVLMRIKRIKVDVGLMLFKFNTKEQNVKYSLERADGKGGWSEVAEWLITSRATKKDWERENKRLNIR